MKRTLTLLAPAAALAVSCASQQKPVKKEDPIQVRVERLFPQPKSLDASNLQVSLEVYNPKSTAVTLSAIEYTADTGDVAGVLEGTSDVGVSIESGQTAVAQFDIVVPFPGEAEAYQAALDRETIPVKVAGQANFGDGTVLDFERQGAVATPSLPNLIIHDAQAARYGKTGLDVTFFLRLVNENPFSITVGNVRYTVLIEGEQMKEQQAGIGARLVAGAAEEYEVSIVLDEKSYENVDELLESGVVNYVVRGTVSIKEMEIPFEYDGKVELAGE